MNKALAEKDILKANRIINHFGKNPSENPLPKIIGSLYYFFSKVLGYHFVKTNNDRELAAAIKINSRMAWQYRNASKKYPPNKLAKIIGYLREYDLKSKGMNNSGTPDSELLKELIFKILH